MASAVALADGDGSWKQVPPWTTQSPPGRSAHLMVAGTNGSVLIHGGSGPSLDGGFGMRSDIWKWTPDSWWTEVWSPTGAGSAPAPRARAAHGGGFHEETDSLVIFGGSGSLTPTGAAALLNDVWAFSSSGAFPGWCQLFGFDALEPGSRVPAPPCVRRFAGSSAGPNASLYGNRDRNGAALPAPGPTQDAAVAVVSRWLLVYGGIEETNSNAEVSSRFRVFDLTSGRWAAVRTQGASPGPRYAAAAAGFLLRQPPGVVTPSAAFGDAAAAVVARATLAGGVGSPSCVGGIVLHGGRPPRGSSAAGGTFDALSSTWSVAVDEASCAACTGPAADAPPEAGCDCACAAAPGREWVKPPSSGYQWHRAYHTLSWAPKAAALAAFGGFASVADSVRGGSVGLVYFDTLLLQLREGGASPWRRAKSRGPTVRFSHGAAASAGSDMVLFGGRFREVLKDTWSIGVAAAMEGAAAVQESDFGANIGDESGLVTIQVLVGILVSSACLLCIVAACVRRSGGRVAEARAVQADAAAGAGGAAMRAPARNPGLTMHDIARLKRVTWPLEGASGSGEAADASSGQSSQSQCPVCLEDFARGDPVRVLPCSHIGHPACMDPWLRRSHKCPLCKQDVLEALDARA